MNEKLLTRKDVMDILNVKSYTSIINLENTGKLNPIRITKNIIRYNQSDVMNLIGSRCLNPCNNDYSPEAW